MGAMRLLIPGGTWFVGNKVVTPISPADWQLFYDGDTVSVTPSIGK